MSDRLEGAVMLIAAGIVATSYLAIGAFWAWVCGLQGITWYLFVLAWPAPMVTAVLLLALVIVFLRRIASLLSVRSVRSHDA
jgi:hypothetical protein